MQIHVSQKQKGLSNHNGRATYEFVTFIFVTNSCVTKTWTLESLVHPCSHTCKWSSYIWVRDIYICHELIFATKTNGIFEWLVHLCTYTCNNGRATYEFVTFVYATNSYDHICCCNNGRATWKIHELDGSFTHIECNPLHTYRGMAHLHTYRGAYVCVNEPSIDWFWELIFRTNWDVRAVDKLSWDLAIVLGPRWGSAQSWNKVRAFDWINPTFKISLLCYT